MGLRAQIDRRSRAEQTFDPCVIDPWCSFRSMYNWLRFPNSHSADENNGNTSLGRAIDSLYSDGAREA